MYYKYIIIYKYVTLYTQNKPHADVNKSLNVIYIQITVFFMCLWCNYLFNVCGDFNRIKNVPS